MRTLIISALLAATMASGLAAPASAQSREEIRRDRQDLRQERRELDHARRHGDRRDIREERRDVQHARRELREDRRDYRRDEWRDYRRHNRGLYARGHWRSPHRYHAFHPGGRIGSGYYGPRYYIADPWRYRLPPARGHHRWVRHYDDVLLVDTRRGIVLDVIRSFFW